MDAAVLMENLLAAGFRREAGGGRLTVTPARRLQAGHKEALRRYKGRLLALVGMPADLRLLLKLLAAAEPEGGWETLAGEAAQAPERWRPTLRAALSEQALPILARRLAQHHHDEAGRLEDHWQARLQRDHPAAAQALSAWLAKPPSHPPGPALASDGSGRIVATHREPRPSDGGLMQGNAATKGI